MENKFTVKTSENEAIITIKENTVIIDQKNSVSIFPIDIGIFAEAAKKYNYLEMTSIYEKELKWEISNIDLTVKIFKGQNKIAFIAAKDEKHLTECVNNLKLLF